MFEVYIYYCTYNTRFNRHHKFFFGQSWRNQTSHLAPSVCPVYDIDAMYQTPKALRTRLWPHPYGCAHRKTAPFSIDESSVSDKAIISRLEPVCSKNGFYLYFTHLKQREVSLRIDDYGLYQGRSHRRRDRYCYFDDDCSLDDGDEEEYTNPDVTLILSHLRIIMDRTVQAHSTTCNYPLVNQVSILSKTKTSTMKKWLDDQGHRGGFRTYSYSRTVWYSYYCRLLIADAW